MASKTSSRTSAGTASRSSRSKTSSRTRDAFCASRGAPQEAGTSAQLEGRRGRFGDGARCARGLVDAREGRRNHGPIGRPSPRSRAGTPPRRRRAGSVRRRRRHRRQFLVRRSAARRRLDRQLHSHGHRRRRRSGPDPARGDRRRPDAHGTPSGGSTAAGARRRHDRSALAGACGICGRAPRRTPSPANPPVASSGSPSVDRFRTG